MPQSQKLIIPKTKQTPEVHFDLGSGVYEINGSCFSFNAIEFFDPIIAWLDAHLQEVESNAKFVFNIPFFNSATSKCLLMVCQKIMKANSGDKNFAIAWCVADGDEFMQEAAETFEELLDTKFEIIHTASSEG